MNDEVPTGSISLSCVILTQGNRPAELSKAIGSVLAQQDSPVELVVVANGADVPDVPPGAATLRLPENAGIPGGRNAGTKACTGDVVLYLDDDAWYPSSRLAAHVRERFAADPRLAVLSFRFIDPDGGPAVRRAYVPRLRASDSHRSSEVTTFLGGACAIRRSAYLEVGGYPDGFFYAHEETDLAWRLLDVGYRLEYDADARICHPQVAPTRHQEFYRMNARNRVLLARRNLAWPVAAVYLIDWVALTIVRERSLAALRSWFAGFAEGWRTERGHRRPIRWRTMWRMTLAGRPPII